MTPQEALLDAADYIDHFGWKRESFGSYSEGGLLIYGKPCCVEGAIYCVSSDSGGYMHANDLFLDATLLLQRKIGRSPAVWNDHSCKNKEVAVHTLRDAALNG